MIFLEEVKLLLLVSQVLTAVSAARDGVVAFGCPSLRSVDISSSCSPLPPVLPPKNNHFPVQKTRWSRTSTQRRRQGKQAAAVTRRICRTLHHDRCSWTVLDAESGSSEGSTRSQPLRGVGVAASAFGVLRERGRTRKPGNRGVFATDHKGLNPAEAYEPDTASTAPDTSRTEPLKGHNISSGAGGSNDGRGVAAGGGGGKGKRKREEEQADDEPLLESYASRHSESESSCLSNIRKATIRAQPGGAHMVSGHLQGQLLKLLATLSGAKRVLDIGTFTGYSALAFAEALPEDGVVLTLESDARAAEAAKGHFASSEHGGKIRLILGQAMDGIDQLMREDAPQFDIIFIDADKKRYWDYYDKVLSGARPLLAPTGILLADNVLFHELVPLAEAAGAEAARSSPSERRENWGGAEEGGPDPTPGRQHASVKERSPPRPLRLPPSPTPGREKPVGGGVLSPTPRRMKIAESLDEFNKRVREDSRVETLMLPLRDGLSVVRWRKGRYPGGNKS